MAESKGNKTSLTINLSFFSSNDQNNNNSATKSSTTNKSPKNFEEPNGVVGLGIVAALNESDHTHDPFLSVNSSRAAIFAVSPRSNPIPIFSNTAVSDSVKFSEGGGGPCMEAVELSEEYTCVISHIGKNLINKREYFDGDELGDGSKSRTTTSYWVSPGGVFSASSPPAPVAMGAVFQTRDFLSSCYLCQKKLHGLDVFMYRGEKAFCSAECRYKQISVDEHKEKCASRVRKPPQTEACFSGPIQFLAGMAAA